LCFCGLEKAADIPARQDGLDAAVLRPRFRSQFHVSGFQINFVARKMDPNTFVKNLTFLVGFWETVWGKMFVSIMGSFHVFMKNVI
jgi:hypothetical protein